MNMKTFLDLDSYNVELKGLNTVRSKNEEHVGLMQIVDKCIQRREEELKKDSYEHFLTPEHSPVVSDCGNGEHIEQDNVNNVNNVNNNDAGNDEDIEVDVETPFINSIPEISSDENVQFISKQQWIERKSPLKNDNTKLHHFEEEKSSDDFQKAPYIQPQPMYQYNQKQQQDLQQQQQQQQPIPSEEYRRRQLIMYYYKHKLQPQQSELHYHPFHQLPPSHNYHNYHNYSTHQQLFQQQRFYIQQQQRYLQRQLYPQQQQQQQQYFTQIKQEKNTSINLNEYGVQLFNDYYNSQHSSSSSIDLQQKWNQQQPPKVEKYSKKVTCKQPLKQYIKKQLQPVQPQPQNHQQLQPQNQQQLQPQNQQTFYQPQYQPREQPQKFKKPARVNVIQPSPINKNQTSQSPTNQNTRSSPTNSRSSPTNFEKLNPYFKQLGHIYARTSSPKSLPANVQPFSGLPTPPVSPMTSVTVHYKPENFNNGSSITTADHRYAPY